ncbi:hypothetical protein PVAG01_10914 [Phlyctema vagabunda]|uniref:BTB domain-containing protein n=1 Tax=Phlyctema vagabunda TaxID=108571 RepID=A0ABR4P3M1_9HELO
MMRSRVSAPVLTLESLGTAIITIRVGPEPHPTAFKIHKELLCKRSQFFSGMFSSRFSESRSDVISLPDDTRGGFEVFLNWAYQGALPEFPNQYFPATLTGADRFVNVLIQAFFFAEKYCINDLQNRIMNTIQDMQNAWKRIPSNTEILSIYANTKSGSKLRQYCALVIAFHLDHFRVNDEPLFNDIVETFGMNSDFLHDYLTLQSRFRNQLTTGLNPRLRVPYLDYDICFFHTHGEGEECHAMMVFA